MNGPSNKFVSGEIDFSSDPAWSGQTHDAQQEARALVSARRAWQFAVVPLARHGTTLEFATSAPRQARAERFVSQVLCLEPHAHILDEPTLAACLHALYPTENGRVLGLRRPARAAWPSAPH